MKTSLIHVTRNQSQTADEMATLLRLMLHLFPTNGRSKMHPLKNILNKMTWDRRENATNYDVYFIHRGDLEDTRKINASLIRKVGRSWFTYASCEFDEPLIPFHRVKRIVNVKTGRAIWTARTRKGR